MKNILKKKSRTDDVRKRKREFVLSRLGTKVGKSKKEIEKLISDELMNLLLKVPFNDTLRYSK